MSGFRVFITTKLRNMNNVPLNPIIITMEIHKQPMEKPNPISDIKFNASCKKKRKKNIKFSLFLFMNI